MTEFGHQAPLGRSYLVKIVCLGLALAVTTHALAQDELQSLSPEYHKWLEEEVVYIITDREREVFLPSFFYLLFFKRHDVGEYRLYSPQADGPLSLIRGKQDTTDSRAALDRLLEISTDLAHASLSFDLTDPPDFTFGSPSLGADMLMGRIVESAKRGVRTDYTDAWLRYGKRVSAEYSFNFVPSRSVFAVLGGPAAIPFVHYSIELDAQYFSLETEEDNKTKYYTTLDANLEVRDQEGNVVVGTDKEIYIELTPSQVQQFDAAPFAYQDNFPLVPGDYTASVILRNRVDLRYTVAEQDLKVEPISPDEPSLSSLFHKYSDVYLSC